MSVTVVAERSCKKTGEGPHWDQKKQLLYYVDIESGDIHTYNPATGTNSKVHIGGYVSLVVPRDQGGFVVGHNRTLAAWDGQTDSVQVLHEVDQGKHSRFNDGKCDPTGRLWAGTMGISPLDTPADHNLGSLYTLDANGTLTSRLSPVDISNGLAWSSDRKSMYYIDSSPRKVYALDYNEETGSIGNQRVAIDFGGKETMEDLGYPDGMCIDADDKLWVACFAGGKVVQVDPKTGERLRHVDIPGAKQITSCCWGGPDLDDLYVTSARHPKMYKDDPEMKQQPQAGSLFRVTGLGVRGLPAPNFTG